MLSLRAAKRDTTIALGNSGHPVLEYVQGMHFRRVPKGYMNEDYFYLFTKCGQYTITYRESDKTLQLWGLTRNQFIKHVNEDIELVPTHETVNTDPLNKHIGNDVLKLLQEEEVI